MATDCAQEGRSELLPDPVSRRRLLAGAGAAGIVGGITGLIPRSGVDTAMAAGCGDGCKNVKDFGAVGDGSTDDTKAIQDTIDAVAASGAVYIPAGTYRVSSLLYTNNLELVGDGPGRTVLKLDPNESGGLLGGVVNGIGAKVPVENIYIEGVTFDGDATNSNETEGQAALLHAYACRRLHVLRCDFVNGRGYGLGLQGFPAAEGADRRGPHTDVYLEKCRFVGNGADLNADGLDVKSSDRVTLVDCYAHGNADKGFNVRGRYVTALGCRADNNAVGMDFNATATVATTAALGESVSSTATSLTLSSVAHLPPQGRVVVDSELIAYSGISGSTLTGCQRGVGRSPAAGHSSGATVSAEVSMSWIQLVGCAAENNTSSGIGISATENSENRADVLGCHSRENGGNGLTTNGAAGPIYLVVTGGHYCKNSVRGIGISAVKSVTISESAIHDNSGDGIRFTDQAEGARIIAADIRGNGAYGIRSIGSSNNFNVVGNTFRSNSSGSHTFVGQNNRNAANDSDQTVTFNAAATMTFPHDSNYFNINGTTNITSISAGSAGRVVTLKFGGTLTVVDGANLKLAGNFTTSADDTLTVACDGANWYEVARSAN